jgi:hypothetical protein
VIHRRQITDLAEQVEDVQVAEPAPAELGQAVLCGDVDFRSLNPPPRWVGGVQIGATMPDSALARPSQTG